MSTEASAWPGDSAPGPELFRSTAAQTAPEGSRSGAIALPGPAMDVRTAILERRAVRSFRPEGIDPAVIEDLIHVAVAAPSARGMEPWAFAVFTDRQQLKEFSDLAKREMLRRIDPAEAPNAFAILNDRSFDVFYGAPVLIVICATSGQPQAAEDCCLAAQNLMLAAHAAGLATCPIGFVRRWLGLPATKRTLGIPEEYVPVFPVIVGYAREVPPPPGRRAPLIFWR